MYMFYCSNRFQNQKQGNHQNLRSTKKDSSLEKCSLTPPFSTATIFSRRSLGQVIEWQDLTQGWGSWVPAASSPVRVGRTR